MEHERDSESTPPLREEVPLSFEWLQLTKYLLGELDVEECAEVERWIAAGPVRAPVVVLLRRVWQVPLTDKHLVDSAAALQQVMGRIDVSAPDIPVPAPQGKRIQRVPARTQRLWPVLAGGAAVLVAMLWGGHAGLLPRFSVAAPETIYATHNAQRANITLPDGSTVSLGVASRLEVPGDFAHGHRVVRLDEGEALFTVAHVQGSPFIVRSGIATTQVLGTTFLVRHYAADSVALVAVREGKVAVRSRVLTARQQVVLDRNGSAHVEPADASQFAFASGVLVLSRMTLREAIPQLNRWYDVDVRLGDPALAQRQLHGSFVAGSIGDLDELLQLVVDARVVRDGRVLTLYPK